MSRIISLFLIVLFLSPSFAQIPSADKSFRVIEPETRITLAEKQATVSLAVENPVDEFSARIKLEIIAPNDDVQAVQEISQKIGRGKQNLTIPLDLSKGYLSNDTLLWYRLRYEIRAENSSNVKGRGIISFSQILPEVFELKTSFGDAFAGRNFRVRVQSINPANQNAVVGVEIEGEMLVEKQAEKLKAAAKTDAEGFATLEFKLPDFKTRDDLDLKIVGKKNNLTRELEEDVQQMAGKFVQLVTDKPIYQPNQTVNLRLYSFNQNRSPAKDNDLTLEIEDENTDEIVFSEKLKTSRFGIAFAAWKIPENTKLGNYQINVKNDENDAIGFEQIKITRYDLPNFYVEAKPDRTFYLPDQKTAKIEINGKYLFGKPLTDAKVRIVSDERGKNEADIFGEINGTLSDEGKFSAEIDLSRAFEKFEPSDYRRFQDIHFSAYVTDLTTNRTEPRRFDLRITNEPIHVYLIGDTNDQSSQLPLNFYVSTFYADGSPADCEVGVYELIDEDVDGKPISPELGKSLAKIKTNSYGAAKLKLPLQFEDGNDDLDIKIIASDSKGLTGSLTGDIDTDTQAAIQIETDKIAYRKGEPFKVSVVSSQQKGLVYVDIVKNSDLIYTTQVKLENGRAELVLPYREEFKNVIEIAAYFESDEDDDLIIGKKNIFYPTPTNLEIEAKTSKDVYRPGEQVEVKFRSRNAEKSLTETALGVLVIDKAVEERARIESETDDNSSFLNRTFTSRMADFFGQEKVFGNMTVRDVKNLDLSKPLAPDLELALEIALGSSNYRPQIKRSRAFRDDLEKLFTPYFREKMNPVLNALNKLYREKDVFPNDEKSLREILLTQGINFNDLKDAWGNEFRAEFRIDRDFEKLTIWSLGADKLPNTADDLSVLETNWKYFVGIGKAIDSAMRDYTTRTNGFITDYAGLRDEILKQNVDLDNLRDAWGNPYRFEFTVDRTNYLLTVKSNGVDGKPNILGTAFADDFYLWTNRTEYFTLTKANLIKGFNDYVGKSKTFPRNENEMRNILQASGFNTDETKDIYGRPFYIQQKETVKLANYYRYQAPNLKVVKQKVLTFFVKSVGADGIKGNYDDFEMANFTGATSEEEVDFKSSNVTTGRRIVRQKNVKTPNGAIGGTVFDANGAVIPNATVTIKNASRTIARTMISNEDGEFLIDNLPEDVYSLEVYAPNFKLASIINLSVEAGILIELDITLDVGTSFVTVDVSAPVETFENSSSSVSNSIISRSAPTNAGIPPSFTPRVRDYFAETLVWSPELVTDKKGAAQLKFKMADSLTTWKLYVVGSDENGDFGVVEKELQTFQPFFAELEPPRVLTEGDRIDLPVPIRNYTDNRQKVSVSMAENDWSRIVGGASQNIEVPANASANAIFSFQATSPVTDGKQRVTALAKKDGDAIEKPVTVRPNGKEVVETQSNLFEKEASFDVNFPANAFPNTRKAEVKIYPNMLAHVAESVDGLLKRPYGCGEQTTSSTYPNLMILKIEKELKKDVDPNVKAKAQEFLEEGYKRLLNYQTASGGFSYWGKTDTPDAALTAYILRFLHDAEDFTEVDERVVERAEKWLLTKQNADGAWATNKENTDVSTAYILRSLALTAGSDSAKRKSLQAAVEFLQKRLFEINDPFVLANLALASQEIDDTETAQKAIEKLRNLSQPDRESIYWATQNTPFYGWGTTAQIETTALVVQAFLKSNDEKNNEQISRSLSFLLRNKDQYGVWYSTQTTVNVLDALILLQKTRINSEKNADGKAEIFINGKKAQEFSVSEKGLNKPIIFDASAFLTADNNRIEIKTAGELNLTMAQIVSTHYIDWSDEREDSSYFDLKIDFDKLQAKIGEEITCAVQVSRKNTNITGMILAEIGLPPGSDVDRTSLEKAIASDKNLSRYDILPDRVIVYLWASSVGTKFNFTFKPRFGLNAQTAPSVVYDYYNEEASAALAPQRFEVK